MSAIFVIDALWGDSGKGKIASWLQEHRGAELCVRAGTGTNAGHSLYLEDGTLVQTSQIPLAGVLGGSALRIGSRVAVDPVLLDSELKRLSPWKASERLGIDYRCPVILPEYREAEIQDEHLRSTVGSTLSGTGFTQAQFVLRKCPQAKDIPGLSPWLMDVAQEINMLCEQGRTLIVEGSQGTQLSLALSPDYPFCTSANCTTVAAADQVGLNWRHIGEVVLVVKASPSRVGNGPLPDEMDATKADILGIAEYGVWTGRRRRKTAEIPWDLILEAVRLNGPTGIALSFCDHYDPEQRGSNQPTTRVMNLVHEIEERTSVPVQLLDLGKSYGSMLSLV